MAGGVAVGTVVNGKVGGRVDGGGSRGGKGRDRDCVIFVVADDDDEGVSMVALVTVVVFVGRF